jgi:hypothetical protein
MGSRQRRQEKHYVGHFGFVGESHIKLGISKTLLFGGTRWLCLIYVLESSVGGIGVQR